MKVYHNKWINKIIALQHEDGSWGDSFHSLSRSQNSEQMTTEMALRRLHILGLKKNDPPIQKALTYMENCLLGKDRIPDRREKVLNYDAFESMMLATWISIFDPDNIHAKKVSSFWASIITKAFKSGYFNEDTYQLEYRKSIPSLNRNERLIGISQFYMVNLLKSALSKEVEENFIDYILHNPSGIFYIYNAEIANPPSDFNNRNTSYYISALEQIADYTCAKDKLSFVNNWLESFKNKRGKWDMGPTVKDGIYFPISDSWRKIEMRENDCTIRILNLLDKIRK